MNRQIISALSDLKSQGAISTRSLSLIHILRFILPRIRQVLTLPSVHFTITLSPPTSLITRPSSSPSWGITLSFNSDSERTFFLPILDRRIFVQMGLKGYCPIQNKIMVQRKKLQLSFAAHRIRIQYQNGIMSSVLFKTNALLNCLLRFYGEPHCFYRK